MEPTIEPCIVCGFTITHPIFDPKTQPLMSLHRPVSQSEALKAENQKRTEYRACANCGHIYNVYFDYKAIPYEETANLMYNQGAFWKEHQRYFSKMLSNLKLPKKAKIIEIGCGAGEFLGLLKSIMPEADIIGFEPGPDAEVAAKTGANIIRDYFVAGRDIAAHKPDLIYFRHMLEHLPQPFEFMADISYHATTAEHECLVMLEVPCIINAIHHVRFADYIYEHVSNFTPYSLEVLFKRAGYTPIEISPQFGDEVLVGVAKLSPQKKWLELKAEASEYYTELSKELEGLKKAVWALKSRKVAFWGGTGRGASFLNSLKIMAEDFPLVVDSDPRKIGRHVPGTGQKIILSDDLIASPVQDIVIIPFWRAGDIFEEITRKKIPYERLLIPYKGRLAPFPLEKAA